MHSITISVNTRGHKPMESCLRPTTMQIKEKIDSMVTPSRKNRWNILTVPIVFSTYIA